MVRPSNTATPAASRNFFLVASALLCFALLISSALFAQSDEWKRLSQQVQSLSQQGDYKGAIEVAQKALALAEQELVPEHPAVVVSLESLGDLYVTQGRYADAEPLYNRALAILEKAMGSDNPFVASSLNKLAGLYRKQGRYAEAEPFYQRSLLVFEKLFGPNHPQVAESLDNLAEIYRAEGRYPEAEAFTTRLLFLAEKVHGPNHPNVATSSIKLADLHRARGRYSEAEPLLKRALAIREKAFGPNHPDVVAARESYVQLLRATGREAEASEMQARASAPRLTKDPKKIPVAVSAGDNDPFGRELALVVTEALGASQSYRVVDHEGQPTTPRILVMLRSAAAGSHAAASPPITTMAFINYRDRGLMQLIDHLEQNCDRGRLEECAKRILSKLDEEVEWLRKNMWDLWKNL